MRQRLQLVGECGGEHDGLAVRPDLAEDGPQLWLESHLEEFVRLIEDEERTVKEALAGTPLRGRQLFGMEAL